MESRLQPISDTEATKLIREVKKRPCIWNQENENYSDRYHLAEAWGNIAKRMDMPEEILRAKWKNLRDFFRKEVKKNNAESVDEYCGKWRYFKNMGFLLRPGEADDESRTSSEIDQEAETDQPDTSEFEAKFVPQSNLEVFLDEPVPEKRHKPNDDNDYDMMFLKSLTPFFKQLKPTRNLIVRSKMQDLLLNEIAAQEASRSAHSKKS